MIVIMLYGEQVEFQLVEQGVQELWSRQLGYDHVVEGVSEEDFNILCRTFWSDFECECN